VFQAVPGVIKGCEVRSIGFGDRYCQVQHGLLVSCFPNAYESVGISLGNPGGRGSKSGATNVILINMADQAANLSACVPQESYGYDASPVEEKGL
jgi:hypothetical protein